ncbi:hypothetical protein [Microbacterium hydrocarbonoxydans]|uniref:hypothetical protein n=1 Tax=Microbacterium hydrocarbonoxydans TaxID=273678 RepID=UPI0013DD5661|nr:hypothetical protein [Microbacterium hydrocarbonoxydans]
MDVHADGPAAPSTRFRAWVWGSLALLPISFVFAFVAGEGIATLLGPSDDARPPLWIMGIALTTAALVFALPLLLTAWLSGRAAARGERAARAPLLVGVIVVASFILVNVASGLLVLTIG